jgi:type II secretory pathway component HofQ
MSISHRPVALFDVDDTLCDTFATRDGVARPVDQQAQRWLAAAPIAANVARALACVEAGMAIVLVTARGEAFASETVAQVESFGIPVAAIFPRVTGDNRVDWKVKADAVARMADAGFTPVIAFDDKERNCQMFREAGIEAVTV